MEYPTINIGTWHEREERIIDHCPSYLARLVYRALERDEVVMAEAQAGLSAAYRSLARGSCSRLPLADHERLKVTPGDYAVRLAFVGGYTVPMPYWLLIGLDTVRVSGVLYGFGGVNYELPAGEAVRYFVQSYSYSLKDLVNSGRVTLKPEFAWLLEERPWQHDDAPKTWADVRKLQEMHP